METFSDLLKKLANWLLLLEPLLIGIVVFAFWFPNRERSLFLLLLVPVLLARLIAERRPWSATPLNPLLIVFFVLGVINIEVARADPTTGPFTFGYYILGRPLMGVALYFGLVGAARRAGHMNGVVSATIALALLMMVLGLGSSQWISKSDQLRPIIDLLPTLRGFPGADRGFNVNEIAGGMSYLLPFVAAIGIYRWQFGGTRLWVTTAFLGLLLALFLGQSRLALFGIIFALGLLIFLLIRQRHWRYVALLALIAFTVLEIMVLQNVFGRPDALESRQARDEMSLRTRLLFWESARDMVVDYPLTGIGMNLYRVGFVRDMYPIPGREGVILPHAHNEFVQIAADLGIPGVIVFTGWYLVIGWMLLRIWRNGGLKARAVAAAVFAGLVGHGVFGMGDAIPLWDRQTFIFWWLLGVAGAQYVLTFPPERRARKNNLTTPNMP